MARPLQVLLLIEAVADADWLIDELRCIDVDLTMHRATTEAEYLAALARSPDLMLIDTAHASLDARWAVQTLRNSTVDIPVIMLTTLADEALAITCVTYGADDYLFIDRLGRLPTAIDRALAQRKLRTQTDHATMALAESEERFRQILEHVPDAVVLIDPHHRSVSWPIVACNNVVCRMSGYTRAELIGQSIDILNTTTADRHERTAYLERLRSEGTLRFETIHRRKDGSCFPIEVTTSLITVSGRELVLGLDRDITERTRAAEALRESEERFRSAYVYAPIGMALVGLDGAWLQVNQSLCHLTGYTEQELLATTFQAITHPDDLALDLQNVRAVVAGETDAYQMEKRYFHKHGMIIWVLLSVSLVRDAQHQPCYLIAQIQDITDRKRTEDGLRAAEAQYRTLVEQMPAIVYIAAINEQSSTSYVSPQIQTILGFSPAEWLASPDLWLEQVHPDDRVRVLAGVARAQTSDTPVPLDYRTYTRDGRLIWMRDAAQVVCDETGQALVLQGISLDITEQKLAEEALHTSERLYRTLAANFPNGVVALFDRDLRCTIADGAGLSSFGLTPDAMEGRTVSALYGDAWTTELESHYRAVLAGSAHVHEVSLRAQTHVVHILPVRDEQGAIIAGMLMSQDMTERKRMEAALIEERALLEQRVAEHTAELSTANTNLVRAARLKDEFLASMSHELRTPLTAILGFAELLKEELYGPLGDRQRTALQHIEESSQHLLALINDMLDLAKIGAGNLVLAVEVVEIEPLCQASVRLIGTAAHKKQLTLTSALDPSVTLIAVDPRRFKQILVNLLSNAVKFTPDGGAIGLEMVGDAERQTIDLTVWDTGIGIAADDLPRLFQPFVQLDSRLARQYNGIGLGLMLVAHLVALHGGSVQVTSELGVGSRFTVSLPWQIVRSSHALRNDQPPLAPIDAA